MGKKIISKVGKRFDRNKKIDDSFNFKKPKLTKVQKKEIDKIKNKKKDLIYDEEKIEKGIDENFGFEIEEPDFPIYDKENKKC